MKIHDVMQNTPEWQALRAGKFTASNFASLFMAKSTKGYNDAINNVVYERITGEQPESFSNNWMERGKELEPLAIESYQYQTFKAVSRVGFVERDEWIGASPDGFVGTDGMIQVKCPKFSTLIDYILDGEVPKPYLIQMQGELWVAERAWSDFYVYHPKLTPLLIRVNRDEKLIKDIEAKINEAIETAKQRILKIKGDTNA